MNLLLFPMWLLSGAVFPAEGAAAWIRAVMAINPMTYGVSALRAILMGDASGPSMTMSLAFLTVFGAATVAAGAFVVRERRVA